MDWDQRFDALAGHAGGRRGRLCSLAVRRRRALIRPGEPLSLTPFAHASPRNPEADEPAVSPRSPLTDCRTMENASSPFTQLSLSRGHITTTGMACRGRRSGVDIDSHEQGQGRTP